MDFRILLTFLLLSVSWTLHAQDYRGQVVGSNGSPVGSASVIMLDDNRRTLTFARSGRDGRYTVVTPKDKTGKWLVFVCMGYERDTISLDNFVQGQKTMLTEKSFKIKEVKVVAPKMRQMGDTIDYYVGMFKQKQDRTLEDVLKKMPGISVGSDGSISVGGKRINKFYIEGMDLLGNKYSQATENINAGKVKKSSGSQQPRTDKDAPRQVILRPGRPEYCPCRRCQGGVAGDGGGRHRLIITETGTLARRCAADGNALCA